MPEYRIKVKGIIEKRWEEWFEDMKIKEISGNCTTISGVLKDQAALYGVLRKIQNLGFTLIEVKTLSETRD